MFDKRIMTIHAVDDSTFPQGKLVRYIKTMRALGYRFVTVEEILNNRCGRFSIALTFDDAYKSCVSEAMPVLKRFAVPALLFVPTGLLGKAANDETLLRCECYENEATMDVEDVNRWLAEGFSIGFHMYKHLNLYYADGKEEIENDFYAGMQVLKANGWSAGYFAYPKGFLPRDRAHFENLLSGNGFRYAFTINWGGVMRSLSPFYVNRVCLGDKESFLWSILKTLGMGDAYFKWKRMHKEQII